MVEPDLDKLKKSMKLPVNATFHGWLIHNPKSADFLHSFKEGLVTTETFWTQSPSNALVFPQFHSAVDTQCRLQLTKKTVIAAAFDLGQKIIIAIPAPTGKPDKAVTDKNETLGKRWLH